MATEYQNQLTMLLSNGQFILGKGVAKFEDNFSKFVNCQYAVGVASGLDALKIILRAARLSAKLSFGDKILVPANTYIATIFAIIDEGFLPILVDPCPITFNINLDIVKQNITKNIKAIMNVHLYGLMSTGSELREYCDSHGLMLFEDASQAHGAECQGLKAGEQGHAAAFSLYPTKNLGALGDAGIITTSDSQFAQLCKQLRNYGRSDNDHYEFLGINSRLDEFQALILNQKLRKLNAENKRRNLIAKEYEEKLHNSIIFRKPLYQFDHVYHQYTILMKNRDRFINYCKKRGFNLGVHYRVPPHRQNVFKNKDFYLSKDFPITDNIHDSTVSLPVHPSLSIGEIQKFIQIANQYE